jgi:rieske iron-sulfur protein
MTRVGPAIRATRRGVLKAVAGLGVVLPLIRCVARATEALAQSDPKTARPQPDDRLVRAVEGGSWSTLTPAAVPPGGPPVIAYPMDPATGVVRDGSRLNQVLLVHLEPADLAEETRARAVAGIVAYSAVCTHTGCDQWEWESRAKTIKCPCHFSTFDVKDAARVLDGPAPRRLPALPLKAMGGVLVVAGGFVGRPGFQQGGA